MATSLNKLNSNKNISFNKLIIQDTYRDLTANISMDLKYQKLTKIQIDDNTDLNQQLNTESTLFYSNNYVLPKDSENPLIINTNVKIDDDFFNNIRKLNKELSYNCSFTDNDTKFYLITKYPNWRMAIYIVNEEDFKKLQNSSQSGGYKQKYLKYKAKYLELKNQMK
jgi:hypothetical protein